MNKRIAIVVSHPIQHFCPQYASWAKIEGVTLKVFFGSNLGAQTYFDKDFKTTISWDNLYLDRFDHEFLNGDKTLPADKNLRANTLNGRLSDFKPTLVVHYGYFQPLARQAYQWALKNKVKLAYISDAEFRQYRPLWKRLLKYPYLFIHFKNIDYFLTVGDANETYYRFYGVPVQKLKRMHFSIDIVHYEKAWGLKEELRQEFRRTNGIDKNDIVLSVVGKLVDWKCQDQLITLLQILESSQPGKRFYLLIAGSGPKEEAWKEQAVSVKKNKVLFLGFVKPEALPAVYAATDIYVHPALIEPHSLSISEAIYMGCPVIVSDTCGSWGKNDDVQETENGFVYPQGDINAVEVLVKKIVNEGLIEKMGTHSHHVAEDFQLLAHGKVLEAL